MNQIVHRIAGVGALVLLVTFMISTLISELFLDIREVLFVKQGIAYGLAILIPLMAIAGISGFQLSKSSNHFLVNKKRKRMSVIAGLGILILIPSAITLYFLAKNNNFSSTFYIVQLVEIILGSINITLMIRNSIEGKQLKRKGVAV